MIELVTFLLRAGVDEADFLAADKAALEGFYYQQPGLARRTTARSAEADGEWLCLTVWSTEEAAAAAAEAAHDDPLAREALALIDLDTFRVRRYVGLPG